MFGRFGAWLKRQTTQEARPGIRPCLSAFVVAVVWRNHTTRPSAVGYLLVAARWFVVNVTAITEFRFWNALPVPAGRPQVTFKWFAPLRFRPVVKAPPPVWPVPINVATGSCATTVVWV